jgi:cell division protein FtsW (lipid II flippase)
MSSQVAILISSLLTAETEKEKSSKDAATIISIFPIFIPVFIFASFKNKWFLPNVSVKLKVSGFRCQQPKSTRWVGVAHEMDFLSPVLAFSCNPISVQDSIFPDT